MTFFCRTPNKSAKPSPLPALSRLLFIAQYTGFLFASQASGSAGLVLRASERAGKRNAQIQAKPSREFLTHFYDWRQGAKYGQLSMPPGSGRIVPFGLAVLTPS
jgi:hypothetical protein